MRTASLPSDLPVHISARARATFRLLDIWSWSHSLGRLVFAILATASLALSVPQHALATQGGAIGTLNSVTVIGGTVRVGLYSIVDINCTAIKYLRVEIWALSSPYDPTQHNPYTTNEGRQGFQIASKDLGLLPCNATQAQIYDLPLQPPPPGNYYLGVFLMASPLLNCRTPDGYCILDHFNNALQQSFGSSAAGTAPASAFAPTVGLWWNPAEPGTGYSIDIKHGVLVATVFSYKANGDAEWYLASGPLSADGKSFVGTLDKYQGGQCIFCAFNRSPTKIGNDGIVSIQFSSPTSASLTLPGGRVVPIQPQAF